MFYDKIPEDTNKVTLFCDYDEFKMELISLETPGFNSVEYSYITAMDKITVDLKTDDSEIADTLTNIMMNYSTVQPGCHSPLYFTMETPSDVFYDGIITNVDARYANSYPIFTLIFNRMIPK